MFPRASRLPAARAGWILESVKQVNALRAEGVPVMGYTYWPLFSLVGWAYRQGNLPLGHYLMDMGLWDLRREKGTDRLLRVETAAAQAYRAHCAASVAPLGNPGAR